MSFEQITVVANGVEYREWEEAVVTAAYNHSARDFQLSTVEIEAEPFSVDSPFSIWNFPPGTEVEIYAGADLLLRGLVDKYMPEGWPVSHKVKAAGRGTSSGFVDASAIYDEGGGRFENMTVLQIVQKLAEKACAVVHGQSGPVIPFFQIQQGSTAFLEALRLTQQAGMLMKGMNDGTILLFNGPQGVHSGELRQGDGGIPIERMGALISWEDIFQRYQAIGQNILGVREEDLRVLGEAHIPIGRCGIKRIVDNADTDQKRAQDRANWEARQAIGWSIQAHITVPGFRDAAGVPWEPGFLVIVTAPWLKLIGVPMAVQQVEFVQSRAGTVSNLTLVNPVALGGINNFEIPAGTFNPMWGFGWLEQPGP